MPALAAAAAVAAWTAIRWVAMRAIPLVAEAAWGGLAAGARWLATSRVGQAAVAFLTGATAAHAPGIGEEPLTKPHTLDEEVAAVSAASEGRDAEKASEAKKTLNEGLRIVKALTPKAIELLERLGNSTDPEARETYLGLVLTSKYFARYAGEAIDRDKSLDALRAPLMEFYNAGTPADQKKALLRLEDTLKKDEIVKNEVFFKTVDLNDREGIQKLKRELFAGDAVRAETLHRVARQIVHTPNMTDEQFGAVTKLFVELSVFEQTISEKISEGNTISPEERDDHNGKMLLAFAKIVEPANVAENTPSRAAPSWEREQVSPTPPAQERGPSYQGPPGGWSMDTP